MPAIVAGMLPAREYGPIAGNGARYPRSARSSTCSAWLAGMSVASSALASVWRTYGQRLRSALARDIWPASVLPMMTPVRSLFRPTPAGRPAAARARAAVSSASQ